MFQKIVLFFVFPVVAFGERVGSASQQKDVHYTLDTYYGVPDLDLTYTSNMREALRVLNTWTSEDLDFGLYLQCINVPGGLFYPKRIALMGISRGNRVLIFDMRPYLRPWPQPLPKFISDFLEFPGRTFFGMGIMDTAARLAFEFDCVVQCIDFRIRSWEQMQMGGGLYGLANRYLRAGIQRPESLRSLSSQAVHTYLQWALSDYFSKFFGYPKTEWVISEAELFGAGPVYLRVPGAKHDWSQARAQWMRSVQQSDTLESLSTLTARFDSTRRGDREGGRQGGGGAVKDAADYIEPYEVEGDDVFGAV